MGVLEGRRVLVTGASSGIGRATALACTAAGAAVAGLARRGEVLAQLERSDGVIGIPADVTDPAATRDAVTAAASALGGLDALVNAAGIARPGLVADADPADWRAMVDVNVLGLLHVTQPAIPHLRAAGEGASIINISSMSGRRVPAAAGGTYAATKFAVHALGEALRQELQADGIRVTTIAPGFVATPLFDDLPDTAVVARYRRLAARVGIAPEDVAAAVVHALAAPPSVTTVEIALVPTRQDDAAYADAVED